VPGIKVGTDAEMTPRLPIASVGYALRAATADSADGGCSRRLRRIGDDSADTTLTREMYYSDLTIDPEVTLSTRFRIFVKGT